MTPDATRERAVHIQKCTFKNFYCSLLKLQTNLISCSVNEMLRLQNWCSLVVRLVVFITIQQFSRTEVSA